MSILPANNDDRAIWDIWLSQYRLPICTVADEIGTFRILSDRPCTTEELAENLGVNARALAIHLGAIAAMGLIEKRGNNWRAGPDIRRWLNPQAGHYQGAMLQSAKTSNPLHTQLMDTLKTGDKASGHVSAAEEWERGELPPEMAARITAYMHAHSLATARGAAQQDQFSTVTKLLDVGGGSGIYCIEIAKAFPQLCATVMEIKAICHEADRYISQAGMTGQVSTMAVDMFRQEWPTGFDAHFFSNVFHDWSEKTNRMLAEKSFAALPSGGRIFLNEVLMDDDGCGPWEAAAFSVLMLLGTRGKQYSLPELRDILEGAGFKDVEAAKTGGGYYSILSAIKP